MNSKVYYLPFSSIKLYGELLKCVEWDNFVKNGDFVAIKLHFGEEGNKGFVKPEFVRPIVKLIKDRSGRPFLTDANTIYVGKRADAVSHLQIAQAHGFSIGNCGAPVIIADGLRGNSGIEIAINQRHFKSVSIARDIHFSDCLIAISHFKGHELAGFGGAIKNIGMGSATRKGKYSIHDSIIPQIKRDLCVGCSTCIKWCPSKAITLKNEKAVIDSSLCVGCGECILSCPEKAIKIPWDESARNVQEKIVEYFYGAVKGKKDKLYFFNFVNFVTAICDCYRTRSQPLIPDVGIFASKDPVAIDQASVDLANRVGGKDIFREAWPDIDWNIQLEYAENIGLGTRRYQLIEI